VEHTCAMGDGGTVLAPVQAHGIWRVRITWPNGKDNFVGKFSSESDALEWIAEHPWLTEPSQAATSEPAGADRPPPSAPPNWKPVSIEFDGSSLNGSYGKLDGMLTVKWAQRTKTMKAGRLPPKALARTLLRELAEEEKRKA
jgi:hypothetical protein